jgi:hypothetical protein
MDIADSWKFNPVYIHAVVSGFDVAYRSSRFGHRLVYDARDTFNVVRR